MVRLRLCWRVSEAVKVIAILNQSVHAFQRVIGQRAHLERLAGIRPAATQIEAGSRLKAEAAVEGRLAQRHHCGIAKLIQ